MDAKYGSPFVESEIVLAASAEDFDEVRRLLGTMLPGERRKLADLFDNLADLTAEV